MTTFAILASFIFGTLIGSFLNVVIWRLPRDKSIQGRSECAHCKHQLVWTDLIPVLSFLLAAGKCRYCKKPISFRYPLIEIVTGLLFALTVVHFMPQDLLTWLLAAKVTLIIGVAIAVFVIDLEHYLILDKLIYPATLLMAILIILIEIVSGSTNLLVSSLLSAAGAFVIFWLVWFISKGRWMGFGDVKLAAWLGLALAWPNLGVALFLAFIGGAIIGLGLITFGKKQMSSQVPFGTFLAAAAILAALYGPQLWKLYWGIYGL